MHTQAFIMRWPKYMHVHVLLFARTRAQRRSDGVNGCLGCLMHLNRIMGGNVHHASNRRGIRLKLLIQGHLLFGQTVDFKA